MFQVQKFTETTEELVCEIRKLLTKTPNCDLVTVDGWMGSGKTCIASSAIKPSLDWRHVEGDKEFLEQGRKKYVLNEKKLKLLLCDDKPLIIDSVLMLDHLTKVNVPRTKISIYFKRVDNKYEWVDQHFIDPSLDTKKLCEYYNSKLVCQLIDYHRREMPHEKADIVHLSYHEDNNYGKVFTDMFKISPSS